MRWHRVAVIAAVGCALAAVPLAYAHRLPSTGRTVVDARMPADEMPEELRAAIPQRGPSLPRPDTVKSLRRQRAGP